MGEPYDYRVDVLYARASCPKCYGIVDEDNEDFCQCIEDQLTHKSDYIRLVDGDIEVRSHDA